MSETLKFGNGQWATKVGSTLAYNDENGNFKPLPFNFTRSTSATRVNKDGLIEVVTNNKPRIDFLNNSNGALLLEPQRINLITFSEEFENANWIKFNTTVAPNEVFSPNNILNADKIIETSVNNVHLIGQNLSATSGVSYTYTVFAKKGERNILQFSPSTGYLTAAFVNFDLENGVVSASGGLITSSITSFINGWYRCTATFTANFTGTGTFALNMQNSPTATRGEGYLGDGTSGLYLWGAQLEAGSNATSYIPTQGATATRVAETCSQTPPSGIIGQTEGTVYFEYFKINRDVALISIDDNTTNNRIFIESIGGSGIRTRIIGAGTATVDNTSNVLVNGINKIALGYANNNVVLYHNGIQIFTDNTATIPITSILRLGVNVSNSFQISDGINDFKLYDTRLSNTQLQQLTNL